VVYDATDPRRATFYRAASQSSVFNPVTGEFDGSSSVSGDSEVTGHETNETPAEKNRFERNLETIFVDANISLTPPDDEQDASSEYDDTDYAVNTDPPGSVWGAAASGFVSGFFSRKTVSAGLGAVPVVGTVLSVGELAFAYDYIGDEDVDRRVAGVGLVVGLLPGGKPIGKLVAKNFDKLASPLTKLFSKAPVSELNQTYNLGLKSSRTSVLSANRKIYDEFVENGGKLITKRDVLKLGDDGAQILGEFNSVNKTITLYRGSNLSTVSEELIHFKQILRQDLLGKRIPMSLIDVLERDAATVLKQWGFVPR
jgi:hypothetical protein